MTTPSSTEPPCDIDASGITQADLFTDATEAVAELQRRREDAQLERRLHESLGESAGIVLKRCATPTAVLFRQVASPTHEAIHFLELADRLGLQPIFLEFHGDKFVTARNKYKHNLGKMPIYQHTASDGTVHIRYHTLLDFPEFEGDDLGAVQTLDGESLVSFHHRMFKKVTGTDVATLCVDGTPWFSTTGTTAQQHYRGILPLFIRDAILFENYLPNGHEGAFVKKNVVPAFAEVTEAFGMRPLIVRLLPEETETDMRWDIYPKEMDAAVAETA